MGNGDFLIIESGPQDYLQTASSAGRYILEIRKGGVRDHYQAVRNDRPVPGPTTTNDAFTFEEICAALTAYVSGVPMPRFLKWQPLDMGS